MRLLNEILRFFKSHWPHIALAIPGALVVTAYHELAHCIAVWIQKGSIISFTCIPSAGKWGEVKYEFPSGLSYNSELIALAPYIASCALIALAWFMSSRSRPWTFAVASTVFVWLFIVPAADIANAAIPYVIWDLDNDLRHAFGSAGLFEVAAAVAMAFGVVCVGYPIQKRLYRDLALHPSAYGILAAVGFLLALGVTAI